MTLYLGGYSLLYIISLTNLVGKQSRPSIAIATHFIFGGNYHMVLKYELSHFFPVN